MTGSAFVPSPPIYIVFGRCSRCKQPMCDDQTRDHRWCSGACECGGLIEQDNERLVAWQEKQKP